MAVEKFWEGVSVLPFTADGNKRGEITLTSTSGYKVKMDVIITSATQPTLELEVKQVVSGTLLKVGPKNDSLSKRTDISAYLVADGAAITANHQPRSSVPLKDINRAIYEEEPTVSIRVVQVDQFGDLIGGVGGVASDVNLRDGFGNRITSTTNGADQCLDVDICNPVDQGLPNINSNAWPIYITDGINNVTVDNQTESPALVVDSLDVLKIYQGRHFFHSDWVAISGAGTTHDILFVVGNDGYWPHLLWELAAGEEFIFNLYEGTTTSADGTLLSVENSNRNSINTPSMTLFDTPTITVIGTLIDTGQLSSGNKIGGDESRDERLILKQNTKYLIRFTKVNSGSNWLRYLFSWYEART